MRDDPVSAAVHSPGLVCVTGLPRAGSTLLCQILAAHPDIACDGHSSPLCNTLLGIRRQVSADEFFLSQLDAAGAPAYARLQRAMTGYLRGWLDGGEAAVVVDKNRAWLHTIEMALTLAPELRMIVCLRDLTQIAASIEARHQQTILVDFIDGLADYDRFGRADALFGKGKVIGDALVSLNAVNDLPAAARERLFFLRFEDLMANPAAVIAALFAWLGVAPQAIDFANLPTGPGESDSHYRLKYPHTRHSALTQPARHELPARITRQIHAVWGWYYEQWYPDVQQPSAPTGQR